MSEFLGFVVESIFRAYFSPTGASKGIFPNRSPHGVVSVVFATMLRSSLRPHDRFGTQLGMEGGPYEAQGLRMVPGNFKNIKNRTCIL